MVDFVNKLELNSQKYKTNGSVRAKSYKKKLLFQMKDFMSFVIVFQSMFLCQAYSQNRILMESVSHNFNSLTFVIQNILHINIW